MVNCKRCGKCCTHISLPTGHKNADEIKWLKYHNIEFKEGMIDIPLMCKHYNPKLKTCKIYHKRPKICRDYFCCLNLNPFKENG